MKKQKGRNLFFILLTLILFFFNFLKSWFSYDINVIVLLVLNILGFLFNIYIIVITFRCKEKSILQLIVLGLAILLNFVSFADYKVYLEFSQTKDIRMEVIEYYQESNEGSSVIILNDKYKYLSQEGMLINYDGKVFSFPIMTTVSMYEGCFIVYAEKEEELTNYISRIYFKKELDKNWYYIKS